MVMMDSTNGKVLATVPIGEGVDGSAFDPGTQLAFSSCGQSATVTIAHEDTPDKLTVVQTLKTERGARTMALDPKTHKIYLPTAKFEPQPEPAAGNAVSGPKWFPARSKSWCTGWRNNGSIVHLTAILDGSGGTSSKSVPAHPCRRR